MIRKVLWGMLTVVMLGAGAVPALAAEEPSQPYIVLVGIDKYQDKQILPRENAENDAKALYDTFTGKDGLKIDAKRVKLLLASKDQKRGSETANRANILKALHWATSTAGKHDLVIFGFFGQGAPLGERACYFASDSTFAGRAKDAIASGDFEHELEALKSNKFIALLDVNFLGFDPGKEAKPDPVLSSFYREFYGKEDSKGVSPSRVVMVANSGLKASLHKDKQGFFAQVLVDAFKGQADSEGYEPDGVVTISELVRYVRKELPHRLRTIAKTDDEKGQLPIVLDFQTQDFVVERNPEAYPQAKARLEKFQALGQKNKLSAEIVEEGTNLLSRMPKLEARQRLRKAYQKFADGTLTLQAFNEERGAVQAITELPLRDAENYALLVMKAVGAVRRSFVKDTNSGQLVENAVSGLYLHLNEKVPSTIKEKLDNAKSMKDAELIKVLTEARLHLGKREDLANGNDVTHSLHPMLGKLDKHTDYIDPATLKRMIADLDGHFFGIGVQIRRNNIKDALQIVTPIKDSPAYKAGLRTNDLIINILREFDNDGKPLKEDEKNLSTKGMTTEEAVKKILGKEGTKIKLIVEREGKPIEFNLVRGKVEVESVLGYKRGDDDTWNYVVDPENKICYVRLTGFTHNTYRDLDKVMRKLQKQGIKGFILDLRFNPGGLLDQAVKISDLFIDDGVIVSIRPRNAPETSYIGKSDGSYLTFPMVCLVNGGSASASEIVSACLQDHHRALVMGSRSYGKGSVQTIHPFDTGGKLKLTTATFWRPSGKNLNRASTSGRDEDEWGVTPDTGFTIKLGKKEEGDLQEHLRESEIIRTSEKRTDAKSDFRDRQLEMALEYLRNQIKTASKGSATKKAS